MIMVNVTGHNVNQPSHFYKAGGKWEADTNHSFPVGRKQVLDRVDLHNEPLGTKGTPLVGEEVRKEDVGKVGSW